MMNMLALVKDGNLVKLVKEGSRFEIEDNPVMPAILGWSFEDYSLEEIEQADPTPIGFKPKSIKVEMVDGRPKYITELEPVEPRVISSEEIDRERDRRVDLGFQFNGILFQSRPEDRENIMGSSQAAGYAVAAGAQIGDYRWHGGDSDFMWIAADNSLVPMDAPTMISFGLAAMAHKQSYIFLARSIKDMSPRPGDYREDVYWSV